MSRQDENRFSVLVLERDVMMYRKYKIRYNFYYDKYKRMCTNLREANVTLQEKEKTRKEMEKFYDLYISKLRYLETNYRRTNIYTRYHEQLENNRRPNLTEEPPFHLSVDPPLPTAVAQPCSPLRGEYIDPYSENYQEIPTSQSTLPTAPPLSRSQELTI